MTFRGQSYARLCGAAASWCIRHTWITLSVTIALLLGASYAASHLTVDPSPEAYLRGTEAWEAYARFDQEFEIGETIVIALREPGGTVFDAESVGAVAELDRVLSGMPAVKAVLSIASAAVPDRKDDVLDLSPLLAKGPITKESAILLGGRIRRHSMFSRMLVDERHETTFLFVQLTPQLDDAVLRLATVREIRDQADRFRSSSRTVHLAGTAVTKEAIAAGVQHDTLIFFPAAVALLTVLLWIMFGDLVVSLIPMSVVGFSSVLVVGVLAALGIPMNMATATVPTMILVVGLSDSVHFLAELRRQYALTNDRDASLVTTVENIALPCLLTAATSAVGFAALVTSRVGPLREFGGITAIGLMLAYACTMLVMPVLLRLLKYPKSKTRLFPAAPVLGRVLTRFAILARRRMLVTLAAVGLMSGACIALLSMLKIDSDFVGYLDKDHRLRRDIAVIERTLGGADTIEVILDGKVPGAFQNQEQLRAVDRLGEDLRGLEGVYGVFSLADYLRLANQFMTRRDVEQTDRAELPSSPEAVAQMALVDPVGFSALTDAEMRRARMMLQIRLMSTEAVLDLAQRVQVATEASLKGTSIDATVTGLPPMFAKIVRHLVEDAAGTFGIATFLIWIAMVVGLRNLWLATVCMIPNILPVKLTFATMALLGLSFDTNSAFVACLGIGIAVDDTIHIAARYQRAREEGSPTPEAALQYAITHAGHPVVLTALLLAVGFSVLCLSSFAPTMRVGLLSAILVAYALVFDLVLTPVLLISGDRLVNRYAPHVAAQDDALSGGGLRDVRSLLGVSRRRSKDKLPKRDESLTRGGALE